MTPHRGFNTPLPKIFKRTNYPIYIENLTSVLLHRNLTPNEQRGKPD